MAKTVKIGEHPKRFTPRCDTIGCGGRLLHVVAGRMRCPKCGRVSNWYPVIDESGLDVKEEYIRELQVANAELRAKLEAAEGKIRRDADRIERLLADNDGFRDRLERGVEGYVYDEVKAKLEAAEERVKELEEHLQRYGQHDGNCKVRLELEGRCDCGFWKI